MDRTLTKYSYGVNFWVDGEYVALPMRAYADRHYTIGDNGDDTARELVQMLAGVAPVPYESLMVIIYDEDHDLATPIGSCII